jgi:ribosomal protein L24
MRLSGADISVFPNYGGRFSFSKEECTKIADSCRAKLGNIKSIFSKKSLVVVEGVAPRIKYVKNQQGGDSKQIELPVSIHISIVRAWDTLAKAKT